MSITINNDIQLLETEISRLQQELLQARENVQSWVDTNASLSRNAAEARAKNQGSGRGILSSFLGPKFRSAMRAGAAASNAAIAKDVARKRSEIAAGKAKAQEHVKYIQSCITQAKTQIRELKASQKAKSSAITKVRRDSKTSVDLLYKLKEAHSLGLLTDIEYEEKRAKLARDI